MNYYIQGDPVKADKIKAAFEKKGYDISWPGGCANPDVINIGVERDGAKYVVAETSEYIKDLIKTHPDYKELELPIESNFKVGGWVVYNGASVWQVDRIDRDMPIPRYELTNNDGDKLSVPFTSEYNLKEWTIADAKDGDVLIDTVSGTRAVTILFRGINADGSINAYCGWNEYTFRVATNGAGYITLSSSQYVPATKEQRGLLFAKIRGAGYEWDAEKKELRRIINPKFKVGDDIKTGNTIDTIAEIDYATRSYICESGRTIWFENEDLWHLAPKPHYDIANFYTGMPVLVRADNDCSWEYSVFSRITGNGYWKFSVCNGVSFTQCIPFDDDTKHLLGTADMCPEEYINW